MAARLISMVAQLMSQVPAVTGTQCAAISGQSVATAVALPPQALSASLRAVATPAPAAVFAHRSPLASARSAATP
eukprot:1602996-Alexandrium_andersonii.AAC.1